MHRKLPIISIAFITFFSFTSIQAQPSAFRYQGSLSDGGSPANGTFQMQFRLCKNATCSIQVGQTISVPAVVVTNGVFSVDLEFTSGAVVWENDRYLEVGVRRTDQEQFTILLPRQPVLSAPFSIKAKNADTASSAGTANFAANASNLGGLPPDRYVQSDAKGNVAIGTTPNGSKLTVAGVIESTSGGVKFPDGTTQASAGLVSVATSAPLTGNGTAASPLGIQSPIVIRDNDSPGRQPVSTFRTGNGIIYTVPSGKRLIIEYISGANLLSLSAQLPWITVETPLGYTLFNPETWVESASSKRWLFSKQTRIYAPAGSNIIISWSTLNIAAEAIVYLNGYLVDVQ